MKTSFPRLITRIALFAALAAPASLYAQIPVGSSLRATPNEIDRADPRVSQVIEKAERHFKQGQLNLADNKREQARDEFDKAVDSILESGMDARNLPRLQTYYLELVEKIYRLEVPSQQSAPQAVNQMVAVNMQTPSSGTGRIQNGAPAPEIGFKEQKFEPSPTDEYAKLVLTPEEQNVNPGDVEALEQAKNSVDFGFNVNPLIQQYINYYQGRGRSTMETGLRRSGQYMKMARRIFKEEGVPEDITWLAQVESAWRTRAYSSAAASGLWQFIPGTGRTFGLRQTAWVDERNSLEQATRAAAKYLKWLSNRYNGNWELAMAAYNTGEGNIDRAISRAGTSNYWAIYPFIVQETRNYVPNILATILIAKNPEKYGFHGIRPDAPLAYDIVQVPTATSLQLIADASGTTVDYLRMINPELRRDVTPRGEAYNVRVPAGRAKQFIAVLKRVPGNARETARVISVTPGEDLQSVAARTGTSVAVLQQMNGSTDPSALGGKVVVPNSTVQRTAMIRAKAPGADDNTPRGVIKIKARAGDTIAGLAARYNVSADEMARLNGRAVDAQLEAGFEVKVPSTQPASTRRRGR